MPNKQPIDIDAVNFRSGFWLSYWLIDWFYHVSPSRVISCVEVRESRSLYVYIFGLLYFKSFFFSFCARFYRIRIIFKQTYLTLTGTSILGQSRLGSNSNKDILYTSQNSRQQPHNHMQFSIKPGHLLKVFFFFAEDIIDVFYPLPHGALIKLFSYKVILKKITTHRWSDHAIRSHWKHE